jgi:hypothetical protein
MRARLVTLATFAVSLSEARAIPPPPPRPFVEHCSKAMPSSELSACIDRHARGARVRDLSRELRIITVESVDHLFLHTAGQWRRIQELADANYEVVSLKRVRPKGEAITLIELGHIQELGGAGSLHERVLLTCPGEHICGRVLVECTVMRRGRAVEVFHGTVDPERIEVTGDRRLIGPICASR